MTLYQWTSDVVAGRKKIEDVPEGIRPTVARLSGKLDIHTMDPYGHPKTTARVPFRPIREARGA